MAERDGNAFRVEKVRVAREKRSKGKRRGLFGRRIRSVLPSIRQRSSQTFPIKKLVDGSLLVLLLASNVAKLLSSSRFTVPEN